MRRRSSRAALRLARVVAATALAGVPAAALGPARVQDPDPARPPECYRATLWSIATGLPQGSINDLLLTAGGELWLATFGGLIRFDGIEFRVFDLDTLKDLDTNRITALATDGGDGLWFGTQTGRVSHLVDGRIVETFPAPGDPPEILALVRHPGGSLWVQTSAGAIHRLDSGRWTTPLASGSEGRYEGLCLAADGSVAAAVGADLVLFDPSGARRSTVRAPVPILSLAARSGGGLWLGLADGVGSMREGDVERVETFPMVSDPVTVVVEDGRGGLWLGTHDRPWHVVPGTSHAPGTLVDSSAALPEGFDVRCIARDREGDVWLGANGQGLVRFRPHRLATFGPLDWGGDANAVVSDGHGGAWVAIDCKGLARVRSGEWLARAEVLPAPDGGEPCLRSLLRDRRGRIWAGEGDRIIRREDAEGSAFAPVLGERRFPPQIGPLVETQAGDVWIATTVGHLARLDPDDRVVEEVDVPGKVVSLATGSDGSLWIGGEGVVHRLLEGRIERLGADEGIPRGDVRAILPGAGDEVWIATYGGGLARLSGGHAARISRAEGLADAAITSVLDDGLGRLWMLSNVGLMVVPVAELVEVADRRRPRIEPVVLGPDAGVPEASFGSPAGFRDEAGRLWFGTLGGVVRVDPREFPFNRTAPRVRIEKLLAEDVGIPLSGSVAIPAGTRRLAVEFTTFALVAPERVRFRYRLEGFEDRWNDGGASRRASYTALRPGAYTFEVAARNEDGVWSEAPATLRLEVLPAWWQTASFRIAAVLAAGAGFLAFHRARIARVHRRAEVVLEATRQRAQAEERASRLRQELEHVARVAAAGELATSLAHEVNQPLAAIVTNAQAGKHVLAAAHPDRAELEEILREIGQQGQRASEVIRRLREFLRKRPAERRELDLNEIVRDTIPLLRRELEDQRVDLRLDLAEPLPRVEADPVGLQQVVLNLVKNACEALAESAGERRIEVATRARDGRVEVEIRDSGPGIRSEIADRLFQPFTTTKEQGMGLGLAICRSIVEAHEGRLSLVSAHGSGAVFRVELPARADLKERS